MFKRNAVVIAEAAGAGALLVAAGARPQAHWDTKGRTVQSSLDAGGQSTGRVSRFRATATRFRCATRSGCRSDEDRRSRRPAILRQQRRAVPLRYAQRVPV